MNPRAARFLPATMVRAPDDGHAFGWVVRCACGETKTIGSNKVSALPPDAVVKKLTLAGWRIGKRAQDDMCPRCDARARSRAPEEHRFGNSDAQQLTAMVERFGRTIAVKSARHDFAVAAIAMSVCLRGVVAKLDEFAPSDAADIRRAIGSIDQHCGVLNGGTPPPETPTVEPVEPEPKSGLMTWLEELARQGR